MRKSTVLLLLTVFAAAPLAALAQTIPNNAKVDALFAQWDKTSSPGVALAVIKDDKTIYQRCYGMANLENGLSISAATVFIIASLSKQFTVFCILLLVQGGKLNLDDDVRKHIPEVPDLGKKITIRHLIHHTSGLREQRALASFAGWRAGDILTERDLLQLVSKQKELNFEPGNQYLYCNTSYLLQSIIVKRVSGKSLRDFARENVFEPLGMKHTQIGDDPFAVVPNLAPSYNRKGGVWQHSLVHDGFNGAGNVQTTIEDLALWDRNFYDPKVGGRKLIDLMHEKFTLNDGKEIAYAGGLNVSSYRGLKTVDHTGSIAGYRTILLRFPEQKFSVIILANAADVQTANLARKVADIYLADQFKDQKDEKKTDKKPLPGKAALPQLSEDQLKAFTGSFYSEELEVLYRTAFRDGKLWLQHRKGEIPLTAIAADRFQGNFGEYAGQITLRFVRNAEKQVDGFTVDCTGVKGLRFVRGEVKVQK